MAERATAARLAAENEALRAALRQILEACQNVSNSDQGAAWRTLGHAETVCERALRQKGASDQ